MEIHRILNINGGHQIQRPNRTCSDVNLTDRTVHVHFPLVQGSFDDPLLLKELTHQFATLKEKCRYLRGYQAARSLRYGMMIFGYYSSVTISSKGIEDLENLNVKYIPSPAPNHLKLPISSEIFPYFFFYSDLRNMENALDCARFCQT